MKYTPSGPGVGEEVGGWVGGLLGKEGRGGRGEKLPNHLSQLTHTRQEKKRRRRRRTYH